MELIFKTIFYLSIGTMFIVAPLIAIGALIYAICVEITTLGTISNQTAFTLMVVIGFITAVIAIINAGR